MRPAERLLHEVIIRALQMILNAWKRYVDDRTKLEGTTKLDSDDRPAL